MKNNTHNHQTCQQSIRYLEQEIDYLNKQYTIINAQRLNYQQRSPNFKISPYHVKLYEQMKVLNLQLRQAVQLQQTMLAQEQKGFDAGRLIDTENDLIIQRLRQHIYQHQIKISEYKLLIESQKQSVFNLKNRPFMKKQIVSQNYGQLKRANEFLTENIVEKVRKNRQLQLQLGQLKRQYQLIQLPRQQGDNRQIKRQ